VDPINYDKLKLSLKRLQERYSDYLASEQRTGLLESDRESIKESCIQRFEVCFDTLWKHLKKYLETAEGLTDVPGSPNGVFKSAFVAKVIDSAELWIDFNQKRGATSHDYSGIKADETFAIIGEFISHAVRLYEYMTGEIWQK